MQKVFSIDNNAIDELFIKISLNDMDSLEKLYGATKTMIFGYAFSILKNVSESEDVMQDTYINIYKNIDKYNSRNKALAWMITITKNLCLEKIRRKKKIDFDTLDNVDNYLKSKDSSYDKVLINAILNEMTDEERQIFILNINCGFTFLEISRMLDLKLPTVLSKYNRAIKKVRKKYKEEI